MNMKSAVSRQQSVVKLLCRFAAILLFAACSTFAQEQQNQPEGASPDLLVELKRYPHKILFETKRDGNWEIYHMNADGSNPVNLTRTKDVDELYPKASPDGKKISFCSDEIFGDAKVRNLYVMNADGSKRVKIADNAREPCWSGDGNRIAYLKGEFEKFTYADFATKGIFIYDLKTKETSQHPNQKIRHLYCLNWSADSRWFVATVHGGMGFSHSILALEANGDKVYDLKLEGCRPDLTADGKRIGWGNGDYCMGVADLDLSGEIPKVATHRNAVESADPIETYHTDWSPDGKYIVFSRGPKVQGKNLKGLLPEFPGVDAPNWNTCIADVAQKNRWVQITSDGQSNKEPDWVFQGNTRSK